MKYLAILLPLLIAPLVSLADPVQINIFGTVKAMPCVVEKTDYLIDLQKVNTWNIRDSQKSSWVDFVITLKNCPIKTKEVSITLTGTPDATVSDYFKNSGTASNVGLDLQGGTNKSVINNGTTLTATINTQTRTAEFPFSARMAGYGTGMKPGSFRSHLEFVLLYN